MWKRPLRSFSGYWQFTQSYFLREQLHEKQQQTQSTNREHDLRHSTLRAVDGWEGSEDHETVTTRQQRNKEEDAREMMRALKGTGVSEQIAQDSAEGNWFAHNSGLVVV